MANPSAFLDVVNPRSEAGKKHQVLVTARSVRRAYRRADTAGEKFERWIDRQIERKTRIMPAEVARGVPLFEAYWAGVRALEEAMADFAYISAEV